MMDLFDRVLLDPDNPDDNLDFPFQDRADLAHFVGLKADHDDDLADGLVPVPIPHDARVDAALAARRLLAGQDQLVAVNALLADDDLIVKAFHFVR